MELPLPTGSRSIFQVPQARCTAAENRQLGSLCVTTFFGIWSLSAVLVVSAPTLNSRDAKKLGLSITGAIVLE